LVQLVIDKVEEKEELVLFIDIGYPSPMISRKTIIEVLEESADLVFIGFCSREDNYGFTKIERGACCRFLISKNVIFGDFS
jgi:tryptophan synthase alpha subunit